MNKSRSAKRAKPSKAKRQAARGHLQSEPQRAAALAHAGQLHNAGELARAAAIYDELLGHDPRHERALFLRALVDHQRGDQLAARARFERLLELAGEVADHQLWYARILRAAGDLQGALAAIRRCRELDPQLSAAIHTESLLLQDSGQHQDALDLLRAASRASPDDAPLLARLGELCLLAGDTNAARSAIERALELDPSRAEAWVNLGLTLQAQGHPQAATLALEQALRLAPDNAEAHYNLAVVLENNQALERAITHAQRAVQLRPERGDWVSALGTLLSEVGELEAAMAAYRRGLQLRPDAREHSSLLSLQQYMASQAGQRLDEARRWAAAYTQRSAALRQERTRRCAAGGGKLRIAYVSADFREHSVSYFFEPLLAAHDRGNVEVTCYANSNRSDAVTARLAQHARMRGIWELSDAAVAELAHQDGIDVLIDLSGHTSGHRLGVFARRGAPLQLAYLGYPGTTGVPEITWRLTDALVDPEPTADARYSERLYRLPRCFCCFQPPAAAPSVSALPARSRARITFGSFNKYMKLSDGVLRLWSRTLLAIPGSRLMLQSRVFADAACRQRALQRFAQHGVTAERLDLHGTLPLEAHLRLYEQIDIALDTFPWNGHTTTCLALHMGVPVLSLAGDCGAARMAVSVMHAAGLPDWVAQDEAAFVTAAQHWATDLTALAELRAGLRVRLARSPLCDASGLARHIEAAYRQLLEAAPSARSA